MTQYPESGVKLIVDTKDAQSALDDLLSSLNDIQGQDYSATVTIEADTSDMDSALQDLPLDGETVDFTVAADVELSGDELPVEGETIDTELNVEETDTAKKTLAAVETIKNLKILETVWNIAGTAVDIFGKFEQFAIEPLLSIDEAVAHVNAQTNNAIPNAHKLISGIFYDDLGESIDQVGKMVTAAAQLGVPIEEATRAALAFTKTFSDQNPETVLNTLNQMVIGKLAPNFTEASDLMVRAFQNGANKGGDLLQVIGDNATAIHDLGLTGPESLSFIKTGLDNGFKSAQQVIDVLLKIKQNVTNAAGNSTSDVSKTLNILGIANPAETGEAWSAEFFTSVIEAIKNAPGLTDTDREALFSSLAGGKQGGKVFSSFLQISPEDATTIFANVKGAADAARAGMDDSLKGAVGDFLLAAEEMVTNWLSSAAIDLPGKIAALKTGLQDALTVLGNEGTLGEALTVALKPIGFDDEFQGLESALGNFVIGILQAVAQLQDITGHGTEAAGTRATIAGMSTKQLAFDLEISNPDDLAKNIAVAVSRGVTPQEITSTISDTIDGLVSNGAIKQAQALLDEFEKNAPNLQVAQNLNGEQISQAAAALADGGQRLADAIQAGIVVDVNPNLSPENAAQLQREIDDAIKNSIHQKMLNTKDDDLTSGIQEQIDATSRYKTALDELGGKVDTTNAAAVDAARKQQAQADATKKVSTNATSATKPLNDTGGALVTVTQSAQPAATSLWALVPALDMIVAKANAVGTAADVLATKTVPTGGGGTTPAPAPTGGGGGGGGGAPPDERGLRGITSALLGYVPGASSVSGGGNNYTAVNNNFIQSPADADRLGYSTAAQLRGMAGA